MADKIISFSKARKARDRARKKAHADANAAKFGRSKSEKTRQDAEVDMTLRKLDAHRRSEASSDDLDEN